MSLMHSIYAHWLYPFNWSASLGVWFHVTLNLILLQGAAERGGPIPLSSPLSSTERLHRVSQISFLIWLKNKGIFGGLAILIIEWADPKDPTHSVATQLLHVIQRRHKAGKEEKNPEPCFSAAASSLNRWNTHETAFWGSISLAD